MNTELDLIRKIEEVRNNTYDLGLSVNKKTSWLKSLLKNINDAGITLVNHKSDETAISNFIYENTDSINTIAISDPINEEYLKEICEEYVKIKFNL